MKAEMIYDWVVIKTWVAMKYEKKVCHNSSSRYLWVRVGWKCKNNYIDHMKSLFH